MELAYKLLADLLVVVHFTYVGFVVFGLALTLVGYFRGWDWVRNIWFRGIHLAMIGIVVAEAWLGIACPLTVWEKQLRRLAGAKTYHGDFIATFVHDVLFFDLPPWVLTTVYTAFGALVLLTLFLVPPRRSPK